MNLQEIIIFIIFESFNKLTESSGMTENMKLCPSASPRGLSLLGQICNKGNEQAGTCALLLLLLLLLLLMTVPGK
jgi:hypothetical protein